MGWDVKGGGGVAGGQGQCRCSRVFGWWVILCDE